MHLLGYQKKMVTGSLSSCRKQEIGLLTSSATHQHISGFEAYQHVAFCMWQKSSESWYSLQPVQALAPSCLCSTHAGLIVGSYGRHQIPRQLTRSRYSTMSAMAILMLSSSTLPSAADRTSSSKRTIFTNRPRPRPFSSSRIHASLESLSTPSSHAAYLPLHPFSTPDPWRHFPGTDIRLPTPAISTFACLLYLHIDQVVAWERLHFWDGLEAETRRYTRQRDGDSLFGFTVHLRLPHMGTLAKLRPRLRILQIPGHDLVED